MKKILMICTGGTIASEATDAGLAPGMTGAEFLNYVPSVRQICEVDCIQLCNIDSTNMTPKHWLMIAKSIQENYSRYDGFVICHGTDTMAYTAAALSYLVQNSPKPIVLTGSQRPIHMDITDSKTNLLDAFTVASDGRIGGVTIVFSGSVILGTRARKTFSKSYSAFSSINYPLLGNVREGQMICYIQPPCTEVRFYEHLDERVALMKLIPGCSPAQLSYLLNENRAVIIESFGVGGIPSGDEGAFYPVVQKAVQEGKIVAVTTQVQNEGSDLSVYHVGHNLKNDLGVLESYDMTTEAVVAKLMWTLGETQDSREIARMFYTPVSSDILISPL